MKIRVINIFFCLILLGCKKGHTGDCFMSNGKDITEIRLPGYFNEVLVNDKIEVTIIRGNENKVEITAPANLMKNIHSEVVDGTLTLENKNTCNFVRGYKRKIKVKVTSPYYSKITNDGVGNVILSSGFTQDTLVLRCGNSGDIYVDGTFKQIRISSHGDGDFYISGVTNELLIYTNGTNFIHAFDLKVKSYIYIETHSLGDCFVNANSANQIDYAIWKGGSIFYKGNPKNIYGSTKLDAKGKIEQIN
jgi:sRNA-binding carbon storage regulator CsrA